MHGFLASFGHVLDLLYYAHPQSLLHGQVYRATLASTGAEVAVKVQRPGVLETVSLDLYLVRKVGLFLRNFPALTQRFDLVAILDEFAPNFYAELDYLQECANGIRIAKDMATLPQVLIPRCYPELTRRRVHTAQWIDGEKLSQSKADNVRELVNLGEWRLIMVCLCCEW